MTKSKYVVAFVPRWGRCAMCGAAYWMHTAGDRCRTCYPLPNGYWRAIEGPPTAYSIEIPC